MGFLKLSDSATIEAERIESYHVSTPSWDGYKSGPRLTINMYSGKEWYFFGTMDEFTKLLEEALEPF